MYHLPLTLETPAANLALDEELLARAVAGRLPGDVLRLWESAVPLVVLGRSSPEGEVHMDRCRDEGVPVLRRVSGGATVAVGPGCLMYAVVLDCRRQPELRKINRAHDIVLGRAAAALAALVPGVVRVGTSDLALIPDSAEPPRKFSGNSLRVKRDHLLYHGTILYDFPIEHVSRWLAAPVRQPAYRAHRDHAAFLTNFPAPRAVIEAALVDQWQAHEPLAL
jgi:lipoate-protein ligase A